MNRVIFLLMFLSTLFLAKSQNISYFGGNGEQIFTIKKDFVLIIDKIEQPFPNKTHFEKERFKLGTRSTLINVDTLLTDVNTLKSIYNLQDVTTALEYSDGTIQIPTNKIFVKLIGNNTIEFI